MVKLSVRGKNIVMQINKKSLDLFFKCWHAREASPISNKDLNIIWVN